MVLIKEGLFLYYFQEINGLAITIIAYDLLISNFHNYLNHRVCNDGISYLTSLLWRKKI